MSVSAHRDNFPDVAASRNTDASAVIAISTSYAVGNLGGWDSAGD